MVGVYNLNGTRVDASAKNCNCKIIAHRGYHVMAKQNTIASFIDAVNAWFKWIEIDIRKCSDGVYVISHDATVTLYNNGVPQSVTIADNAYSDIKGYTWDSAGKYKLCTLESVFNTMNAYEVNLICDLKAGSNYDILELASRTGVTDQIMLSYYAPTGCISEIPLLNRYENVAIRVVTSNYSQMRTIQESIVNPLYADINASFATHTSTYLPIALSCGIPVLFSGCELTNAEKWQIIAAGCMANESKNISYDEFYDLINQDYDTYCILTSSVSSLAINIGGSDTITAESDIDAPAGYIYGYSLDPSIAGVVQNTHGKSIDITVNGVSAGSTIIRLFTGCGIYKDIPITVS